MVCRRAGTICQNISTMHCRINAHTPYSHLHNLLSQKPPSRVGSSIQPTKMIGIGLIVNNENMGRGRVGHRGGADIAAMTMAEGIKRRYTAVVPDVCPHEPPGRLSREIPNIWQKTNGSDNDDSPESSRGTFGVLVPLHSVEDGG